MCVLLYIIIRVRVPIHPCHIMWVVRCFDFVEYF